MNSKIARETLTALLTWRKSPTEIQHEIALLPWDATEPLATLQRSHIIGALKNYLSQIASAAELELWANLIEAREDIAIEPNHGELIPGIIFQLANPELEGKMTFSTANQLIEQLNHPS